jgi:hypothetical protein
LSTLAISGSEAEGEARSRRSGVVEPAVSEAEGEARSRRSGVVEPAVSEAEGEARSRRSGVVEPAVSSERVAGRAERPRVLSYADLVLLAAALPLFIAFDWSLLGYTVAAVAWTAQRLAMAYADRRTAASLAAGDRRDAFRTTAVSTLGRVWLVSAAVLVTGLAADREDGLAAAILVAVLFTVQMASLALTRGGRGRP